MSSARVTSASRRSSSIFPRRSSSSHGSIRWRRHTRSWPPTRRRCPSSRSHAPRGGRTGWWGTHFFNPPPVMRLLEVVRSIATSDATLSDVRVFGERLGKRIIVAQDRGGFIVNLLLIPYLTHAVRLYESGFATREDIDDGMRLGCGHPMGPLQLLDLIGLDTAMFVCEALYEEYANGDFAPPPLLRRMVAAGYLGRKTGRGFYEY